MQIHRVSFRNGPSFSWFLLLFLLLPPFEVLSAQVHPPQLPQDDTLSVQIAGVRRLIEGIRSSHQLGELKTVCLRLREDGRWLEDGEVGRYQPGLERFLREELNLRVGPLTSCVKGGESFTRPERLLRDAETGEAAAVLRILEPTFEDPTHATVSLGYAFGPLWGQGFHGDLELAEAGWSITDWRPTWIS